MAIVYAMVLGADGIDDRAGCAVNAWDVLLAFTDSGSWKTNVFALLEAKGWERSIGVRTIKKVAAAVSEIAEDVWQTSPPPVGFGSVSAARSYR